MDPKHEQTTNEAIPSRQRGGKTPEPNPQAEMKIHRAEEDVLGVIQNVENQLGALRKAHEEHRQAMADLVNRKRALEEESRELESRESELTSREVELAEMRQDFETRELSLVQRAGGLEQRESKLASQAERLEQQEAELESKGHELERKIAELDDQLAGISKRKGELDALEQQVRQKLAIEDESARKLEAANAELEATLTQLGEMDATIGSLTTELAKTRELHEKAAGELKTSLSKLRGREIELTDRSQALEELAEKAGTLEHELSVSREQYERQLGEIRAQLDESNEQLAREQKVTDGLRAQIEKLERERQRGDSELAFQVSTLEELLAEAGAELESTRAQIEALGSHNDERDNERIAGLTRELDEARASVVSLTARLDEITGEADSELSAERERVDKLRDAVDQLQAQLKETTLERDRLSERIESQPEADPEELAQLRAQLHEAQREGDETRERLAQTEGALSTLREQIEQGGDQAAKSAAQVQELEAQSSELFATIERLSEQLEVAQARPATGGDEWSQRRRQRLARVRKILRADGEKIRLATEALRSRYEQCEQVLTKRAELAEAYEAIAATQRKYHNREVRSGVVLGLIGMLAITLVLAAGSWFISGRVAPGVYASRVTIAAASGEAKLSDTDLAQWEAYITGLTTDPRFLEVAAERMKRRGITEFGVPGELGKEMERSMDIVSAMPGTMVLEYRGPGAQRTQRVLDTFSVALSSAANNARARRADSAVTMIEEPANLGAEPLDTQRIKSAGMIFGGGALLTLIVGGVLWGRLSAAKARFEKDSRVEPLFDDEQWKLPS